MSGPETFLTEDLDSILHGAAVPSRWKGPYVAGVVNRGSDNHNTLAAAVGTVQDPTTPVDDVRPRDWWLLWTDLVESGAEGFMYKEQFSAIYDIWHVVPALVAHCEAARRGWTDVRQALHRWLLAYYAYRFLGAGTRPERYEDPDTCQPTTWEGVPFVLRHHRSWSRPGDKTDCRGNPWRHHLYGHTTCSLLGNAVGLLDGYRGAGGSQYRWQRSVLGALEARIPDGESVYGLGAEEAEVFRHHLEHGGEHRQLAAWAGAFGPANPVVVGRGPRGVWFVAERSSGVSTSPVSAAKWEEESREYTWLAVHSDRRNRPTMGTGSVDLETGVGQVEGRESRDGPTVQATLDLPFDGPDELFYAYRFSQAGGAEDLLAGGVVEPHSPHVPQELSEEARRHILKAITALGISDLVSDPMAESAGNELGHAIQLPDLPGATRSRLVELKQQVIQTREALEELLEPPG